MKIDTITEADWLAATSGAAFALVNLLAILNGPADGGWVFFLCGIAGIVVAVQSAFRDPAALVWAILWSLAPLGSLAIRGATAWLIGPLAALLLVAAELNALAWRTRGMRPSERAVSRSVRDVALLGTGGTAASLAVAALGVGNALAPQLQAVLIAGGAIATIGVLVFTRSRDNLNGGSSS